MDVWEMLESRRTHLIAMRRDFHAHPELAFEEHRTAEKVAAHLESLGIEVHTGIGGTGVVGVIRAGEGGGAMGLRADMDALSITERNDFPHRSRHPGRMHACGHDGHTTMLLAAAEALVATRNFRGTVYLIFQPAEEGEGGARAMIEEGLLDRFPMAAVFGMHNWPGLEAGHFAVHSGPVMACADRFDIEVGGHGAHGAMPHLGVDPVLAGAALVQALQSVASRTIDPLDSIVVSITQFHSGEAYNVIPDRARLSGTVRAFRPEIQERVEATMQRICAGVAAAFGASVHFEYRRGYPPTINDSRAAELCASVAESLVGVQGVRRQARPSMGAEDFAYFLMERPGAYVWLGNGPGEGGCTLHNPHYDFNDEILLTGARYWVRLVETYLPSGKK